MNEISKVAILGAGTMGANIALNFATYGTEVRLTDIDAAQLERGLSTIRGNASSLSEHGLLDRDVDEVVARVTCLPVLEEAVAGVGLVIEAVPEVIEAKKRLFRKLERETGSDVVLASNTSTFVPSKLCAAFERADTASRFVVMHYWNPAHLMPLVEVVPHATTDLWVLDIVRALLGRCRKQAVILRKEIPGFVGNRLAFALQREAMRMVAEGVALPDDIDTVARAGFGRRIPVTGIFGTADLGGLDVYRAVCDQLFPSLCNDRETPEVLKRLVESGRLGMKTGEGWRKYSHREIKEWHDRLAGILVHFAQNDAR
ncbi:MAG: 3-hydroxyacyl-CoA dehydrogenase family protein [Opitutaceae bacterium]|nr:3-hydroxyacyl-CoA dehydrogenase family protein [Opitutaceae bacterium]